MAKPVRYQHQRCLHFITFSCYRRMQLLDSAAKREIFERDLERVRRWYGCYISGYVVMPEHVHLLINEPERAELSIVIQMLKQITSRKLREIPPFANTGRKGGATALIRVESTLAVESAFAVFTFRQ